MKSKHCSTFEVCFMLIKIQTHSSMEFQLISIYFCFAVVSSLFLITTSSSSVSINDFKFQILKRSYTNIEILSCFDIYFKFCLFKILHINLAQLKLPIFVVLLLAIGVVSIEFRFLSLSFVVLRDIIDDFIQFLFSIF